MCKASIHTLSCGRGADDEGLGATAGALVLDLNSEDSCGLLLGFLFGVL